MAPGFAEVLSTGTERVAVRGEAARKVDDTSEVR